MLKQNSIPLNRQWKLSKEERKIAHKLLIQQSKMIEIDPIYKMTLNVYYKIIKEAVVALCDEDGNYLDIYDNYGTVFNVYTSPEENILKRIMDGRSLFHSDYGDPYGILNDIDHNDSHCFKDWVCNAQWGGHPYETFFGDFVPSCIYNDGYNFTQRLESRKKGEILLDVSLDEEYSDYWVLLFATSHRNDEYAMRCFIRLKKLGYPVVWAVDNERDRKMLTKQYMVEKEKQPKWWDLTLKDYKRCRSGPTKDV